MNHRLFIPAEIIFQSLVLFECLPDPRHISMAENSKDCRNESIFLAIAGRELILQISHNRLRHCQSAFHPSILLMSALLEGALASRRNR